MRKPNYQHYNAYEAKSLRDLMRRASEIAADTVAFAYYLGDRIVKHTFSQFQSDVESLGTFFHSRGLSGGEKIAVIGENSYYWLVTYFAATTGGNVIVPLDKDLSADDLRGLIIDSGAKAVIYSDDYADMFEQFNAQGRKQKLPLEHYINMKTDLPLIISQGADLVAIGERSFINHDLDADAVCAIVYTSGTTGLAKGVMLTNKSLVTTTREALRLATIRGNTVLLLPLHHTYPIAASILPAFFQPSTCFINSNLKHVIRDISASKPNYLCVVPLYVESFYKKIWESVKKQGKEDLLKKLIKASNTMLKAGVDMRRTMFKSVLKAFGGNLELIVSGGAPLSAKYIEEFANFGVQILEGYGITECSPIVALNRNKCWKAGSVGLPIPTTEVKIFDINKDGEGEICVRGDIVMKGYYNNPEATDDAFLGNWFRTGDIGYIDDDGFVFITGRQKNLIIRANGKNVHPEELEDKLSKILEVEEVIVYGDDKDIIAEIFINPELPLKTSEKSVSKQIKEINKDLPVYKRINRVVFRDAEFEKTTTKKIKRYNLKKG